MPDINNELTIVSYFCGCGGMDLGFTGGFEYNHIQFEQLPFKIVAAYDFDERCIETYHDNIGTHASVKDLSTADPHNIPKANILLGGFPCQDFSSCGPLGGLDTERGKLYLAMVRYMNCHQPEIVIGENVPNLEKMDNGAIIKKIVSDFEACGYKFIVWKLEAKKYGVPQDRVRLIFCGVRNDIYKKAGTPTIPPEEAVIHPIEWAIGDLETIKDESVPNQSQYFLANKAKKGNGQGDEVSKKGEPAYTIRANAKSRVHFHYSLNRRLTVRECARIQTFPDDFTFKHSKTTSIMQIGNAVPPMLAHAVGKSIANYCNKKEFKEALRNE